MDISNCSNCKIQPKIQSDELRCIYRLICTNCGKHTQDKICPNATLTNPHCDEATMNLLIQEWNSMN